MSFALSVQKLGLLPLNPKGQLETPTEKLEILCAVSSDALSLTAQGSN